MKRIKYLSLIIFLSLLIAPNSFSQSDTLLRICSSNMPGQYISDGQQYISLLNDDEIAEFRVTFFAGTIYRIAACSGLSNGNLIFTVYDSADPQKRNELFSNKNYKNAPYWDFKFNSTMECIIEAQLNPKGPTSGFAILLIGFKR